MWLPWWAVLCVIIGSALMAWLFDHFGRLAVTLPTLDSLAVLAIAVAIKRESMRRPWFLITMAVIAALHALLIVSVRWTAKWVPAAAIVPFMVADLYAVLAILAVVRRAVEKQ